MSYEAWYPTANINILNLSTTPTNNIIAATRTAASSKSALLINGQQKTTPHVYMQTTSAETYRTTMQALKVYQSFLHCQLLLFHFFMCHPLLSNNTLLYTKLSLNLVSTVDSEHNFQNNEITTILQN